MAYKTFLQCVNEVQRRLREVATPSVFSTNYSTLLGIFVNEAKREVEDAWNWNVLRESVLATTSVGVIHYTLVNTNNRTRFLDVFNDTTDSELKAIRGTNQTISLLTSQSNNEPRYYTVNGESPSGELLVDLYPPPDAVYAINFNLVVPQSECDQDSDQIYVPTEPVILGAVAKAIQERGEDMGQTAASAYASYQQALAAAVAMDESRMVFETDWVAQ